MVKVKDIKDNAITDYVEEYKKISIFKVDTLPNVFMDKIMKLQEVKDFISNEKEFEKKMETEYPLIRELNYCQQLGEIGFYMNAKFNAKGK